MSDDASVNIPRPPPMPEQIVDPKTGQMSRDMIQYIGLREQWEAQYLWGALGALPQATLARQEAAAATVAAQTAAVASDTAVSNSQATPTGGGAGTLTASLSATAAITAIPLPNGFDATAQVTASISGGTAPYTCSLTYVSGYTFSSATVSPSPLNAAGDVTVTFTDDAAITSRTGFYALQITDSAATADVLTLNINVSTLVSTGTIAY